MRLIDADLLFDKVADEFEFLEDDEANRLMDILIHSPTYDAIETGESLYCHDCKYWKYYLQESKAVPGLCCDCEWDRSGFCGGFAENANCRHKKEDGSCWK